MEKDVYSCLSKGLENADLARMDSELLRPRKLWGNIIAMMLAPDALFFKFIRSLHPEFNYHGARTQIPLFLKEEATVGDAEGLKKKIEELRKQPQFKPYENVEDFEEYVRTKYPGVPCSKFADKKDVATSTPEIKRKRTELARAAGSFPLAFIAHYKVVKQNSDKRAAQKKKRERNSNSNSHEDKRRRLS